MWVESAESAGDYHCVDNSDLPVDFDYLAMISCATVLLCIPIK